MTPQLPEREALGEQVSQYLIDCAEGWEGRDAAFVVDVWALLAQVEQLTRELQLRERVRDEPWTFKQGTLRERLDWARVQHIVNGTEEQMRRVDAQTYEQRADFHLACVEWYAEMVRDAEQAEAQRDELTDKLRIAKAGLRAMAITEEQEKPGPQQPPPTDRQRLVMAQGVVADALDRAEQAEQREQRIIKALEQHWNKAMTSAFLAALSAEEAE